MKNKLRKKCLYFGLKYLGYWDGQHWAMKEDVSGLPYHGGMIYTISLD